MFKLSFIPRDRKFFTLFEEMTQSLIDLIVLFNQFLKEYNHQDVPPSEQGYVEKAPLLKEIYNLDKKAEQIAQNLYKELFSTFVTPLDREDIHGLTKVLMSIIEHVSGAARRFEMYHIEELHPDVFLLAETLLKSVEELAKLTAHLDNLTALEKFTSIIDRLNVLEKKGDHIYRSAINKIFYHPEDPMDVIKWKDIYERLENAIDKCNSAAGIIMGIVLKYA